MASIGPIGAGVAVAVALYCWGWTRAARYRSEHGKAPWSIPPLAWGALYVIFPVGIVLSFAASRTTIVVDPSLAHREDALIADTAEERERLRKITMELPLLRPPQPDTRGWHLDPAGQRRFRYYDGRRWTRRRERRPRTSNLGRRRRRESGSASTAAIALGPEGQGGLVAHRPARHLPLPLLRRRELDRTGAPGSPRLIGAPGGGLEPPTSGSKGRRSAD